VPDSRPAALADPTPVLAPHGQVRVTGIAGERLKMIEGPPVLHDDRQPHLVTEQALLRVGHQVVKHVLHAATTAKVHDAPERMELIEPGPDEEHHEVAIDLSRHPAASYVRHVSSP
jgi:hypothetical protein